jgi:hypothetical protein
MRYVFLIICLSIFFNGFGQNKKNPQVDMILGSTTNAGFTIGVNLKNINGYGFFLTSYGSGKVTPTGRSGVNYSSIDDRTEITSEKILDQTDIHSMTFGLMLNSGKVFGGQNAVNFILGAGYYNEYKYLQTQYHHVFEYTTDEYSFFTSINNQNSGACFDLGVNINLLNMDGFVIGGEAVYNSFLGFSGRGFLGITFF